AADNGAAAVKAEALPAILMDDPYCARRIRGFEMRDEDLEYKAHDADVESAAAAEAKAGIEAQIKAVNDDLAKAQQTSKENAVAAANETAEAKERRDKDKKDADARISSLQARLLALADELDAARKRREEAGKLQQDLWYGPNTPEVDSRWTCIPDWARGGGLSGAAGAAELRRWTID